jgi:hypothetical protein
VVYTKLEELVKTELKKKRCDNHTILLCDKIFRWYEAGGWSRIEENIKNQVKKIAAPAEKEIKKMKEMAPSR